MIDDKFIPALIFVLSVSFAIAIGTRRCNREAKQFIEGREVLCVHGVTYLKYNHGITVLYDREGKVIACESKFKKNDWWFRRDISPLYQIVEITLAGR